MPRLPEEDPLVRRDKPLESVHTPAEEDERSGHAPRVIYLGELASDPAAVDLPDDAVARIFTVAGELKCALAGTIYVLAPPIEPEAPQDDAGGIGSQTLTQTPTAISGLSLSLEDGEYILLAQVNADIETTGTGDVNAQIRVDAAAEGSLGAVGDPGAGEYTITLIALYTVTGGPETFTVYMDKNNAGGVASCNKAKSRLIAFAAAGSAIATGGGGGDTTLIAHTDTPASYASQALKALRVNSGESAIEFAGVVFVSATPPASPHEGQAWLDTSSPGTTTETLALVTKVGAYTATDSDAVILCDASGGAFTVTLPTAVGISGKVYRIKKIDSSANAITIDADGSETIDDSTTRVLSSQYDAITIISDGSEWWIL